MSDVKAEIQKANARFSEAFRKGSAPGVAASYTQGGMLLPPNGGIVEGSGSIQGFWLAVMGRGIKEVRLETLEVEAHGETAVEVGQYELFTASGKEADDGKYLVIWKYVGGAWKLHRDIWNSNKPAK
mgnify:CR=1 FL=1